MLGPEFAIVIVYCPYLLKLVAIKELAVLIITAQLLFVAARKWNILK